VLLRRDGVGGCSQELRLIRSVLRFCPGDGSFAFLLGIATSGQTQRRVHHSEPSGNSWLCAAVDLGDARCGLQEGVAVGFLVAAGARRNERAESAHGQAEPDACARDSARQAADFAERGAAGRYTATGQGDENRQPLRLSGFRCAV